METVYWLIGAGAFLIFVVWFYIILIAGANRASLSGANRAAWFFCLFGPRLRREKFIKNFSRWGAGAQGWKQNSRGCPLLLRPGDTATFWLHVYNPSRAPIPADEIWIEDVLPVGLTFVSGSGCFRYANGDQLGLPDILFAGDTFLCRLADYFPALPGRTEFSIFYQMRAGRVDGQLREVLDVDETRRDGEAVRRSEAVPAREAPVEREPEPEAVPAAPAPAEPEPDGPDITAMGPDAPVMPEPEAPIDAEAQAAADAARFAAMFAEEGEKS